MGLFSKKPHDDSIHYQGTVVASTHPSIPVCVPLKLRLEGDTITIFNTNLSFTLSKSQVLDAGQYGKREVVNKNKSGVGRAIIGGAVAGPLGAVVGGASGNGTKKTEKQHFYSYLMFRSVDGGIYRLDFEYFGGFRDVQEFNRAVSPNATTSIQL